MLKRFFMIVSLAAMFAAPAHAAGAMRWSTLIEGSRVTFFNGQQELPIPSFRPEVRFDPASLGDSKIILRMDMTVALIAPDRMDEKTKAGFSMVPNLGHVPDGYEGSAVFESARIRRKDKNNFEMTGTLAMNGGTDTVTIPFTADMIKDPQGGMILILRGAFDFNAGRFGLAAAGALRLGIAFELHEIPS